MSASRPGALVNFFGSGTLEATQLVAGDFTQWQITRIWGTWDGQAITGLITEIDTNIENTPPSIKAIDNQFTTSDYLTTQSITPLTDFGYGWKTLNSQTNVYRQFSNASNQGIVNRNNLKYSSTAAINFTIIPAPLPILGLPAVFYYSRKIKKRTKQRSLAPIAD